MGGRGRADGPVRWFTVLVRDGDDGLVRAAAGGLSAGLGFIPGSHSPHYDGEPNRRPRYHGLVGDGVLPAGYAADDGAALVFRATELAEVVASRPNARAYRVERSPSGDVVETELPTRYLG